MKKLAITLLLIACIQVAFTQDKPKSCSGTLRAFDDVYRGEITSVIILAKEYLFNPANQEGSFEEREAKLAARVRTVFNDFIRKRTGEYEAVKCRYEGVDWNKPGGSSWKTLVCQPGFVFVPASLTRTTNGDWKGGPVWAKGYSSISWKTGGHRRSETFVKIDAVYSQIDKRVLAELNIARKLLQDLGIPTKLP